MEKGNSTFIVILRLNKILRLLQFPHQRTYRMKNSPSLTSASIFILTIQRQYTSLLNRHFPNHSPIFWMTWPLVLLSSRKTLVLVFLAILFWDKGLDLSFSHKSLASRKSRRTNIIQVQGSRWPEKTLSKLSWMKSRQMLTPIHIYLLLSTDENFSPLAS